MTDLALPTNAPASLRTMAGIEARRLARHPAFVIGVVLAFGVLALLDILTHDPYMGDLLSMPVIPAFFIGLPSLIATARLTRSTEATVEAIGTAPGTEARRTAALALACFVPFAAGVVWMATHVVLVALHGGAHPYEWWFGTMPDWQVWAIMIALGPVACLGGGLLGVLTGRWLRFPGAAAVMVVVVIVVDMVGQLPIAYGASSELRLWVPWAMFHSGSDSDGTASLLAGNAGFYTVYLLCLCAAAALVAIWHDKAARTARLRGAIAGVVIVGLAALTLAMTTGPDHNQLSKPIPYKIDKG
jgi:hypothetical protein